MQAGRASLSGGVVGSQRSIGPSCGAATVDFVVGFGGGALFLASAVGVLKAGSLLAASKSAFAANWAADFGEGIAASFTYMVRDRAMLHQYETMRSVGEAAHAGALAPAHEPFST